MFDWIRQLIATEQPTLEKFTIVDSSAVGEKVRSITLALTPGTEDSPTSVVSLYWTDADEKVYEHQFRDENQAREVFEAMRRDLVEASDLTKVEKLPEAAALVDALLKRYEVTTDSLINGHPQPLTTTMASRKEADAERPNPLAPTEPEVSTSAVGSPEWVDKTLRELETDYSTSNFVPDQSDILYDIRGVAENQTGQQHSIDDIKHWFEDYYQWKRTQKQSSLSKIAKIVFQNIFFTTPEEAVQYQEKMKKLNPPSPDVNKSLPKVNLDQPGKEEAPAGEGEPAEDEIADNSLSYDDFEKNQAEEQKYLTKRIEREVKDQVESALEQKVATKFSKNDESLVEAMRGVGRTWEEISDYMVKNLKYSKEDVAMFIDHFRGAESQIPSENPLLKNRPTDEAPLGEEPMPESKPEAPKPEAPKPPENLVSPETHDKLLEEHEIKKKDMQEIAKLDGEIRKKAEEPLETRPSAPSDTSSDSPLAQTDQTEQMLEDPSAPPELADQENPTEVENLKPQDHVYVMGDYDNGTEGFGAVYMSQYKSEGELWAVVDRGQNDLIEVPLRNVKKAFHIGVVNKAAARKKERGEKLKAEMASINAELLELTSELNEVVKEAAPFEQPKPEVPAAPVTPPAQDPIKFKPMERAPNNTKDQETVVPSPELAGMMRELNEVTAKLDEMNKAVKTFIAKIESEKQQRLKEFEQKIQPEKLRAVQEQLTQRIGAVMTAMENKTVEVNEFVFRLLEETKVTPYKISDKEMLEKVMAKFEGVKEYVDSVINGAKSKDVKKDEITLYRSPKPLPKKRTSMLAISSRDVYAGALDMLSGMYEDMVSALKLLIDIDDMLESSVGATASKEK